MRLGDSRVTALTAAILFGLSTPLAKGLLSTFSPQLLAGLFYLGSGIGLILLRRVHRNRIAGGETPLTRVDLPWLFGAIVSGGIVAPVLLMFGLQQTTASSASLLLNLEGVFTVLLAWIFFKENIGRRVGLGIIAVLVGSVLISWAPTAAENVSRGALVIIAACLCWGLDNNLTQRVSAREPSEVAGAKGLIAGTINISIGILLGAPLPTLRWAPTALTVGFLTYGLSLAFYVQSLRTLGAARTSAYFCIGPFVGAFVGLALWHESPSSTFTMATISMVAGVFLLVSERHGHMHFHDSLIHSHRHVHDEHHHHTHSPSDPTGEPHAHLHHHPLLVHSHVHYPDIHHRHTHECRIETRIFGFMLSVIHDCVFIGAYGLVTVRIDA